MALIRTYTTIEQSRKLAEILPYNSADSKWFFWKDDPDALKSPSFGYSEIVAESYKETDAIYLPCWSLAALISVLPNPSLHKTYNGWRCDTYNENCTFCHIGDTASNPIDACVAMIEKLHETKML